MDTIKSNLILLALSFSFKNLEVTYFRYNFWDWGSVSLQSDKCWEHYKVF
jgi:hypothetical protein